MKFKGTKGIWEINPRASRNVKSNNLTVANCSAGQNGDNEEEEIANAKLIAACPELLKAVQNFVNDFEANYVMDDGEIVDDPNELFIIHYKAMKKVLEKVLM